MNRPRPKLEVTTARQTVVAALAGALLGYFIVAGFELADEIVPVVPWSVPAVLAVMAMGAWIYARSLPKRIEDGDVSGIEGVRALVVAKSMVMTGAVLAGGHTVYVGRFLTALPARLPMERVLVGGATVLAGLLLTLAGLALERACIVKIDADDNGDGDAQRTGEASPDPA